MNKLILISMSTILSFTNCFSQLNLGPDTSLCLGQQILLNAQTPGVNQYLWSTGETTPQITVSQSGIYSVTVTSNSNSNLIQNGNFDNQGTNWSFLGNFTEAYGTEISYGGTNASNPVTEIDAGSDGIIGSSDDMSLSQQVSGLIVGQSYQLCFDFSRRDIAPNPMSIIVDINSITSQIITANNPTWNWQNVCINFTANSTTQLITFKPSATLGLTGLGMILDNINLFINQSNSQSDSIQIIFNPNPFVDLGTDIFECETSNILLDAQNSGVFMSGIQEIQHRHCW